MAARVGAQVARWVILGGLVALSLAILYRYGPARDRPKWRWVTPGSVFAVVAWLLASVLLSVYVSQFANYQKTFGSLAAVAILLMWFFIGALAVILGAEINAEAEHQTRVDTTRGAGEPMGARGAYHADTLGKARA